MSTKVISSYYAGGYNIQDGNDLLITSTGTVGAPGVGTIYNTTITNHGSISGGSVGAIGMYGGGLIINGSPTYTGAQISGLYGLIMKYVAGSVTNYGVIEGVHGVGDGMYLDAGGIVRNGSVSSRSAVIEGKGGVAISGGSGAVYNLASIKADTDTGVVLYDGGSVINGATNDTSAFIQGSRGVQAYNAAAVVTNYGTVSAGGYGILLKSGGSVTNGSASDHVALIEGTVEIMGVSGPVTNNGTIRTNAYYSIGVVMAGGTLTNGSLSNRGALIDGYHGGVLGATQVNNFGTISDTRGYSIDDGGSVTNGAVGDTTALIEGQYGINIRSAGTVTNFGTIISRAGASVQFAEATNVLKVGAGSSFVGAVLGAGGTLDLLSGTGTITGLFAAGGNVTVSGSMARTTFQDFATVMISAGATFTDKGVVKIAAGQTVKNAGILNLTATVKDTNAGMIQTTGAGLLTIAGSLVNTGTLAADGGTLVVNGAVTGAGAALIGGGTLDLASSFNEAVAFRGTTGVLDLARSKTYTATITGFSKSGGTSLDLGDIGFVASTEATFSGTTQSGVLTVTDGTDTAHINLKGNYTTSTFVASSDGHGGTVVIDSTARDAVIAPSSAKFIEAMAGLGASGVVGAVHTAQTWLSGRFTLASPHVATA